MKISKKILAIALSVMMILSVMPFAAFAATTTTVSTVTEFVTAVAKASAGDTIKLGANIDFTTDSNYAANSYSVEESYVDITGLTIDLDGNTITNNTAGLKFSGSNCVIKKGKIIGVADTYTRRYGLALWNYDAYVQGEADSIPAGAVYGQNVVLEDLEVDGGINILGHRDVIIRDCTVYGNSYYAVYLNFASDVTIESGSYTAANTKANGIVACYNAASLDPQYSTKINIEGGTFTLAKSDLVLASSGPVEISGGTYKKADSSAYTVPAKYIAEGAVQDSETGSVTQTYVAKVNDTCYETLEAALDAATSGDTVTLLADIDYSTTYTERNARDFGREHIIDLKDCTLDLNGHTISTINATVEFSGNGATIQNGTFDLVPKNTNGSYKEGSYALIIDNSGDGNYGENGTVTVNNVVCNGAVNVKKATVELNNVTARTTPTKFYAVWAEDNANVTINSGTYTDAQSGGRGVLATGTSNDEVGATIAVKGGTFEASNKIVASAEANSIKISAGTFSKVVPSEYCAEGFVPVTTPDENGKYTVAVDTAVAEVNGVKYDTLAAAIAAAGTGDTVTLLDDVTVDSPVVIAAGKDIKLDLNGYSLSGNIADADGKKLIQVSGKLEFVGENGGCIYNTNVEGQGHAACQALTGGTVIVNAPIHFGDSDTDMTNANAVNRGCGIQNNGGTLIINDGYYTSIDANYTTGAWAYAILNCAGNTTVNKATVYGNALHGALGCEKGTFTVNGGTFAVNGANNYYSLYCDGGDFTVNGGTFTNSSKNGVNYVGPNSSTTITGGDFTYSAKTPFVQSSSASNPVVSGGTFSAVVPEKCCAPGFEPVTEPDAQGKYTVERSADDGVNLIVGKDITSNYYVDYEAYEGAYKIEYTYNQINEEEKSKRVTDSIYLNDIPEGKLSDDGRVKITVSQAPAQIGEVTEIKILNASHVVLKTLEYSSKTYCDNIIAMDDEEIAQIAGSAQKAAALKKLCHVIIAYGEAAQGVFADYKTTPVSCTSKEVTDMIDAASREESDYKVYNNGRIRFRSVSFACTKDARLRFFLDTSNATGTPSDPVEVNGHTTELKYFMDEGVQKYFIEVSGINAADFDQKMVVKYGGSTIEFSVLDFCTLALSTGEVSIQKLARTLIVYNQLAEEYDNI